MILIRSSKSVLVCGWEGMRTQEVKSSPTLILYPDRTWNSNPAALKASLSSDRKSMPKIFERRRHRQSPIALWYQIKLRRSPFLFFGLPFLSIIIIGSFALSSFTTIRYERHDEKVKIATEEELLKLDKDRRRPDIREEYYVVGLCFCWLTQASAGKGFGQLGTETSHQTEGLTQRFSQC